MNIIKKIWNILKFISCICLILATFYYGYNYLNKVFRTNDVDYNDSFHNLPKDSMDVIVLGSSHAQYSFIPSFFYQDTGLYSYVLGSACQPFEVSYEMLKEALKTQRPKLVVLEVFTATPLRETCEGNGDVCYVKAEYQMRGEERQKVIDYISKEKQLSYRNELINNHNNWRYLNDYSDFLYKENAYIDSSFGYVYEETSFPVSNSWYPLTYDETVDVELEEIDEEYLNKINELCKVNNIDLFLYMMPMDSIDVLNQSYRYKVWDWAKENNIQYIDFVDLAKELDYQMMIHNDGAHSMINGSGFITDYLANYFLSNYKFEHKENLYLNEKYKEYIPMYSLNFLKTEYNPTKYLKRLINYNGTIVMRYDGLSQISEPIKEYLNQIGVSTDFDENKTYIAIFNNGELLVDEESFISFEINSHYFEINKDVIYMDGKMIDNLGSLAFVVFNSDYSEYVVKRISFDSFVWELGYDKYYNKID